MAVTWALPDDDQGTARANPDCRIVKTMRHPVKM